VLAIELKWEAGRDREKTSSIIHVDRRPDAAAIERFDSARADVMAALARRHQGIESWCALRPSVRVVESGDHVTDVGPRDQLGGGDDVDLQTYVDIALMRAPAEYTRPMDALAKSTFALKRGRAGWQSAMVGKIAADIRKWRTDELDDARFISAVDEIAAMAVAQELHYQQTYEPWTK
jgi:hypothetical protein